MAIEFFEYALMLVGAFAIGYYATDRVIALKKKRSGKENGD